MNQAKQGSAAAARKSTPFNKMTPRQKFVFICKLTVSIASFGIIFPNVMTD